MITTDPSNPDLRVTETSGMQKVYLVLSEEERAKGFVRPYRDSYIHRGKKICGKMRATEEGKLGGSCDLCTLPPGHEDGCFAVYRSFSQPEAARIASLPFVGGCGTKTTMGRSISETYARNPSFYGATFCCGCGTHRPLTEFVWDGTDIVVGS